MRTLFFLLLLANLTLFGYIQLDNASRGERNRLATQVQPEKIRLLSAQEVASLGPAKTAALADVCAQWGPFADTDRARALADLEPLSIRALVSERRVDLDAGYWAYVSPFPTRAAAERRAEELRGAGESDVSVVESGPSRYAVSLGVFRTEESARARAADIVRRGIANARAGPRGPAAPLTTIVIRDPPAAAIARLKELGPAYPGAEIRIGSCEKPA